MPLHICTLNKGVKIVVHGGPVCISDSGEHMVFTNAQKLMHKTSDQYLRSTVNRLQLSNKILEGSQLPKHTKFVASSADLDAYCATFSVFKSSTHAHVAPDELSSLPNRAIALVNRRG